MSYVVKSKSKNITFGVVASYDMAEILKKMLVQCNPIFDPIIEQHDLICCATYDVSITAPMLCFEI